MGLGPGSNQIIVTTTSGALTHPSEMWLLQNPDLNVLVHLSDFRVGSYVMT